MKFMHRHRHVLSLFAILLVASTTGAPVAAEYNPKTGRFLQADPNGTGLVVAAGLWYQGRNPTVTVNAAYQLQFGNGMNFYQYCQSNPIIFRDPTGLEATLPELAVTQSTSAYLRAANIAAWSVLGATAVGGIDAGLRAYYKGKSSWEVAAAAVGGMESMTQPERLARVLLTSAVISMSGPVGLTVLAGMSVVETYPQHSEARMAMERATTQEELSVATYESVLTALTLGTDALTIGGGIYAMRLTAASERVAEVMSPIRRRVSQQKQFRHIKDRPEWINRGKGSYFNSVDDAQTVLDAAHSGQAEFLGYTNAGHPVFRYRGVTGYNNNPAAGFMDQPTNVFFIKGTASPSVVPTSPAFQ